MIAAIPPCGKKKASAIIIVRIRLSTAISSRIANNSSPNSVLAFFTHFAISTMH